MLLGWLNELRCIKLTLAPGTQQALNENNRLLPLRNDTCDSRSRAKYKVIYHIKWINSCWFITDFILQAKGENKISDNWEIQQISDNKILEMKFFI
jgi:hypothetical protein